MHVIYITGIRDYLCASERGHFIHFYTASSGRKRYSTKWCVNYGRSRWLKLIPIESMYAISHLSPTVKKSYLPPFARYFDAKIENLRFSFFTHPRDQSFELWSPPPKSVPCDLGYWSKTRDPILLGYLTVKTRWLCVHYVFTWYRLVTDRQTADPSAAAARQKSVSIKRQ